MRTWPSARTGICRRRSNTANSATEAASDLRPSHLPFEPSLAVARPAQLGHRRRLVELGDRAQHLAHQLGGRFVVEEAIGAIGGNKVDAELPELNEPNLLHDEVAREPIGSLDDDSADDVALDPLEKAAAPWCGRKLKRQLSEA
jgi:hypothetical protein